MKRSNAVEERSSSRPKESRDDCTHPGQHSRRNRSARIGGLAYRKVRQRRVAKTLTIGTPNGIVEERFVRIGGIEQWIQIRGEDRDNSVLLVVHGGPGWPNAIFTPTLGSWEKHFTVVQWDQRGVSKTMGRNGKAGSGELSFDRTVSDAMEVTEFLRWHTNTPRELIESPPPALHQRGETVKVSVGTGIAFGVACCSFSALHSGYCSGSSPQFSSVTCAPHRRCLNRRDMRVSYSIVKGV